MKRVGATWPMGIVCAIFITCLGCSDSGGAIDCRYLAVPLNCAAGDCPAYAPLDLTGMCEPGTFIGIVEGVCGNYRFRSSSALLGGERRYWDAATGKLVAIARWSDTGPFCKPIGLFVSGDYDVVLHCKGADAYAPNVCLPDGGVRDAGGDS